MKNNIILVLFLFCIHAHSQQSADRFFNQSDLMTFGSYYYPEQWKPEQWERDIKKMSEMGFEFTHFAEFAWAAMEPEEGKYDFSWLDKSVELAKKYNLKVIMCTPSPTPPAWLTKKYPEILIVNEMGTTIQHGTRQHASWSSDLYRSYVEKIVTELGKRYGNNKTIIGWQIDNEPSHYGTYDYSENAQIKFRLWLKRKYGSIDKLNDTWGTAFWSETYNDFEQVRIPNSKELPVKANPHSMLDFKRFTSDEVADFVNYQNDILRRYIANDQWITTNTIPYYHPIDPARMDHLDFQTYTRYLIIGDDIGYGEQGFRIGNIYDLGFQNDTYRNYPGKIYGVMELQPGQVNWGGYNPQPYPGAVRLWLYHVFAGGSKFVCNYRFRQPLKGSEQYHYGMLQPDGLTPAVGGEEYMKTIQEMKLLRKNYDKSSKLPEEFAKRRTAIMYNENNDWEISFQPQTWQWNTMGHMLKFYNPLKSFAAPVDIISEKEDFSSYPFLIAPAYELLDQDLILRWTEYVENGGHLILSCRTGQKNREAHLWEAPFAKPIHELVGIEKIFFDHMPPNKNGEIKYEDRIYTWNNWADVMTSKPGTEQWAVYHNQFYKGKAAITHRKQGKGTITYIGVDTDDGKLEKDVLRKVYTEAQVNIEELPEGVLLEWRDGFYIGLNYTSEEKEVPMKNNARILVGSKILAPAGVVVWK